MLINITPVCKQRTERGALYRSSTNSKSKLAHWSRPKIMKLKILNIAYTQIKAQCALILMHNTFIAYWERYQVLRLLRSRKIKTIPVSLESYWVCALQLLRKVINLILDVPSPLPFAELRSRFLQRHLFRIVNHPTSLVHWVLFPEKPSILFDTLDRS